MSDSPTLGPLATAYLTHLETIEAGWAALQADMPNLLDAMAQTLRREGQAVVAHHDHLTRTWMNADAALQANLVLTLRLIWSPAQALQPRLSLCEVPGAHREVPVSMRGLFPETLWDMWSAGLPNIQAEALRQDPGTELLRVWRLACAHVDALIENSQLRDRLTLFALLTEVSTRLSVAQPTLDTLHAAASQHPGEVATEEGWPLYVQADWRVGDNYQSWSLTLLPRRPDQEDGDKLLLVLYDGYSLKMDLPNVRPERYLGQFPTMDDFSPLLAPLLGIQDPLERAEAIKQAAAEIVKRWVDIIRQCEQLVYSK